MLDNKFDVVKGRDDLYLYKLSKDSNVINVASKCCNTYLLCRHSQYHVSSVGTSPESATITGADKQKPVGRFNSNLLDEDELSKIERIPGLWLNKDGSGFTGDVGWEEALGAYLSGNRGDIPDGAKGETFDELVDYIGQETIVVVDNSALS
jgi:hypothetical protein